MSKKSSFVQLPPAEVRYDEELAALKSADANERPEGWNLSPQAVVDFICGTDGQKIGSSKAKAIPISEKFVGPRDLIQRCVVLSPANGGSYSSENQVPLNPCSENSLPWQLAARVA